MQVIKQYRFYDQFNHYKITGGETENPIENLMTGSFVGNDVPIVQLGIQALEGTRFYLNDMVEPIVIGSSGIFELQLNGVIEISTIRFDAASLDAIIKDKNATLIIDTIYIDNRV